MRVLVVGGAGYIGAHAVKHLSTEGHDVLIYDNLSTGFREFAGAQELIVGDICDTVKLASVMREWEAQVVMHFAANSLVAESMQNPEKYYLNNVVGTLSLLQAMRLAEVKCLVFSSTAAVYGEPTLVPIEESAGTLPTNVYGRTKLMIEQILSDYDSAYGLKYMSLRYFNACGADLNGVMGEDHRPETHLIPIVLQVAHGQRNHVKIYGTDYDTPDGTCIRDYIHVDDLASAHLRAAHALASSAESAIYNLGTGAGFSVREVIAAVEAVACCKVHVKEAPRRPGDPSSLVACADRAYKELGWQPRYINIEDMVATAWNWHQKRFVGM